MFDLFMSWLYEKEIFPYDAEASSSDLYNLIDLYHFGVRIGNTQLQVDAQRATQDNKVWKVSKVPDIEFEFVKADASEESLVDDEV